MVSAMMQGGCCSLSIRASCCSSHDETLAVQERGLSPCLGGGVTFRISTHLATAKAAEKSDAAAAKHAGAHTQGPCYQGIFSLMVLCGEGSCRTQPIG